MCEEKKLVINCSFCDGRQIREELLADYEQIVLNTGVLAVNTSGKEALEQLPLICNANLVLQTDEELHVIVQDGFYSLSEKSEIPENSVLVVNGNLLIQAGITKENLGRLMGVSVNGCVTVPESVVNAIPNLCVNGSKLVYPDECMVLDPVFVPDRFFPVRAREGMQYFAGIQVKLIDPELDVKTLADKGIRFVTQGALIREEDLENALPLFDEKVLIRIQPSGFSYLEGDVELNPELLDQYGTRLFIDGSLIVPMDNGNLLEKLEMLFVTDTVFLPAMWKKVFRKVPAEYRKLEVVKGRRLKDRPGVTLDNALLDECLQGLTVRDCGSIRIDSDISPERLLQLVEIRDCGSVVCSREQKSAVELISKDIGSIRIEDAVARKEDDDEGTRKGGKEKIRVMNVKQYVL